MKVLVKKWDKAHDNKDAMYNKDINTMYTTYVTHINTYIYLLLVFLNLRMELYFLLKKQYY